MAGGLYRLIFLTLAYAIQILNRKKWHRGWKVKKKERKKKKRKIKGWKLEERGFELNILIIDHLTN